MNIFQNILPYEMCIRDRTYTKNIFQENNIYLVRPIRSFSPFEVIGYIAPVSYTHLDVYKRQLEDISLMRTIPGMTVIVPCDANETRLATKAMLDFQGPCYFRTGRPAVECVTDTIENYSFEIGKGVQLKDGKDVTIIACGLMVQEALKAQKLLEAEGISERAVSYTHLDVYKRQDL